MARAPEAFPAPLPEPEAAQAAQAALAAQLRDGLRQAFPLPEHDSADARFAALLEALARHQARARS